MNSNLSQEDNDFLDKINEMPFEEAFPALRKKLLDETRGIQLSKDRRIADWARSNYKKLEAYQERMAPIWKKEREEKETKEFLQRQEEYKRSIGHM